MSARVLAVILPGQEAAAIGALVTLVAVARAEQARVRLAYFHPLPRPRLDRYDRIVADPDREMTRITDTIVATLEWAARRFDDVGIETVVRFGSPRREIVTEIEVVEPGFVACFTAQGGSPLERLRVWALRRQLARASARVLVVETPARRAPGPRRVLDQPALSTRGENGG